MQKLVDGIDVYYSMIAIVIEQYNTIRLKGLSKLFGDNLITGKIDTFSFLWYYTISKLNYIYMHLWSALKHDFNEYGVKSLYYSFRVQISKYLKFRWSYAWKKI